MPGVDPGIHQETSYYTLTGFRTAHGAVLDALLSDSVARLMAARVVKRARAIREREARIAKALARRPELAGIKRRQGELGLGK